jgi:predicted RNA-binding protein with TRAM domain
MTAPSGETPPGSVNYVSLAEFAAKTQEQWDAEMRGDTQDPWDFMLNGFFAELEKGQGFALAVMGSIAQGLGLGDVWATTTEVVDALGNWVADAVDGTAKLAQDIIDFLLQGFNGLIGLDIRSGFPALDLRQVGVAIGTAIGELNHVRMRVDQLAGEIVARIENFSERVQTVLDPDKWFTYYAPIVQDALHGGGVFSIVNGYVLFRPAADTANKVAVAVSKTLTRTDFQRITTVISKPVTDSASSANTILARVDPTRSEGDHVFAKLTDNQVVIGYVKNRAVTILGSVDNQLKNGSHYSLEAGVGAAANTFRLLENTREILKVTDPAAGGAGSSMGAGFLGSGFGIIAPNPTARPGVVAAFAAFGK